MNLLGIHLTLLIGPTIAVPAPIWLTEALSAVEVTHSDSGRSGFQLTFQIGRAGPWDIIDYNLLKNPLLRPFNRVCLMVRFAVLPRVLMDGFITQIQLQPSNEPGASTLTVIGEDVSVMMDLEEKTQEHPAQSDLVVVAKLIGMYPTLGLAPIVIPPPAIEVPIPTQQTPTQNGTDLQHIQGLATKYGYTFFVRPGLAPMQNFAYWGPPPRVSVPQKALSMNMGPATNVESISFQYNALAPTTVTGVIQDSQTNLQVPVFSLPVSTRIPLASQPALLFNQPNVRKSLLSVTPQPAGGAAEGGQPADATGGLSIAQAMARAQATVDASVDRVVTANGELDALHYGELLEPRGLVGVRGVGMSYDGHYYVQSVTHSIRKGEYKQRFVLNREGTGTLTPLVRP